MDVAKWNTYGLSALTSKMRENAKPKDVVKYTLSVQDDNDKDKFWILGSGSSRHLVNKLALFEDARDSDGKSVRFYNGKKGGASRNGIRKIKRYSAD